MDGKAMSRVARYRLCPLKSFPEEGYRQCAFGFCMTSKDNAVFSQIHIAFRWITSLIKHKWPENHVLVSKSKVWFATAPVTNIFLLLHESRQFQLPSID